MKIVMIKPRWRNDDWQWRIWNFIYEALSDHYQVFTDNWRKESPRHYDLVVKHHVRTPKSHEIDYKLSYYSDLWYFGNGGYSGYSNLVNQNDLLIPLDNSSGQDPDEFYEERVKTIIGSTKFEQSGHVEDNLPTSFVLVPLQVESDTVMKLKKIESTAMIDYASRVAQLLRLPLVIKPHPKEKQKTRTLKYAKALQDRGRAFISEGNIQTLLNRSAAVFVINSGVGFEAVCRHKPVFTFGKTDYHHITYHNFDNPTRMAHCIHNHDTSYHNTFLQNFWRELVDFRFEDEAYTQIINRAEEQWQQQQQQ